MDEGSESDKRAYVRLSAEQRARFLAVLRETGNRKAAAAAIGVEPRLMDQRREHDPELDRDWEAAAEAAHRGLCEAAGPFVCPPVAGLNMIKRGKKGRLQMVASGDGRWTAGVEKRFLAAVRRFGSVRAGARAVGFSEGAVWDRRRKWPAFAEKLEQVLDEAELELEFRIASMGSNVVPANDEADHPAGEEAEPEDSGIAPAPALPFDPDFAMRFLKWREEKRRGRGRWAPRSKPPSIEQVTEKIVRRVMAIKRHRERGGGGVTVTCGLPRRGIAARHRGGCLSPALLRIRTGDIRCQAPRAKPLESGGAVSPPLPPAFVPAIFGARHQSLSPWESARPSPLKPPACVPRLPRKAGEERRNAAAYAGRS